MVTDTSIIQEAKDFVTKKFEEKRENKLAYHNLGHTRQVVAAVKEIAEHSDVSPKDIEILTLAAWFHDLGYIVKKENHEELGRQMAEDFLGDYAYPDEDIRKVGRCILATRMPQDPKSKLEKIMCDADMLHLADVAYLETLHKLRTEIEGRNNWDMPDEEWLRKNHKFLSRHEFFTDYAREKYSGGVHRSLELVEEKLKNQENTP